MLFPELFNTAAVEELVTSKADLMEKQLNRHSMDPLPQTQLPCTSGFVPRPSSTFEPTAPSPVPGGVPATQLMNSRAMQHHQTVHYHMARAQQLLQQVQHIKHHKTITLHPRNHKHQPLGNQGKSRLLERKLIHLLSIFQL